MQDLQDRDVVTKLFDNARAALEARPGGHTRLLRLGFRMGDAAEIAQVELIGSGRDPRAKVEAEGGAAESTPQKASADGCARRPKSSVAERRRVDAWERAQRGGGGRRAQARVREAAAEEAGREGQLAEFTILNLRGPADLTIARAFFFARRSRLPRCRLYLMPRRTTSTVCLFQR